MPDRDAETEAAILKLIEQFRITLPGRIVTAIKVKRGLMTALAVKAYPPIKIRYL